MKRFILKPSLYRIIEIFCGLFRTIQTKLVTVSALAGVMCYISLTNSEQMLKFVQLC